MAENIADLVLDGNAAAGCLHEIFASDITLAQIQCDACGSARPLAPYGCMRPQWELSLDAPIATVF